MGPDADTPTNPTNPTDTPPETPPETPPAPPAPDAAPVDPPADLAPDWPEEARTLVGKLKDENVRYKERWRPIEERFEGLDAADRDSFLDFIGDLRSGDPNRMGHAAGWMRTVLDHLSPAEAAEVAAAAEEGAAASDDDFDPFDRTNIERLVEEKATTLIEAREAKAREQAEIEQARATIEAKANELGYPDPQSAAYAQLLLVANKQFPEVTDVTERLTKAHETIQEDLDRRAHEYLRRKQADVSAPAVPADAVAPSGRKPPATLDDAARSAKERIDKILGGG